MHEHPLIKNWHQAKVIKRARLEGIKKFGAEKIESDCCYSLCVYISDGLEKKIGTLQVVIELDPNESKMHTANNNFDQREYGGHKVVIF